MTRPVSSSLTAATVAPLTSRRAMVLGVVVAALVVALSAQVLVPVPGSPVPMTLQPLAVLVVGGVLGPRLGATALVLYLAAGLSGLPVFAGGGGGLLRLLGPTGGYLLAFPLAAAIVGLLARDGGLARIVLACTLGMVAIHVGGVSQLAVLGGEVDAAFRMGVVPFVVGDLVKIGLAATLILSLRTRLPLGR